MASTLQAANSRTTTADLEWWLDLAPRLTWIWARTYAETAPHSYVVRGQTAGMSAADFVRAGAVIRTFGEPGKYYETTNIYLESADGLLRWWTMDATVANTGLINQATTERNYGERGLEFDAVIVVEPSDFPKNFGRHGPLYTALTRPNRELVVVHSRALPEALRKK